MTRIDEEKKGSRIETDEKRFLKGMVINMGQTDSQFKAFLRFLYLALKDAVKETDREKLNEKMKEILENIQKTLED